VGALLLAIAVCVPLTMCACGGADGTAPPTAARAAGRCTAVPRPLVKAIATRLTVPETLRNAQAVRSATKRVWFVSAEIDGPGLVGDGQIGTWAKSGPLAPGRGVILSVDTVFAQVLSGWRRGDATYADVTMEDDGARQSRDCVARP
jgi:hypothetical protein